MILIFYFCDVSKNFCIKTAIMPRRKKKEPKYVPPREMVKRKTTREVLQKLSRETAEALEYHNVQIEQYPKNGDKYGRRAYNYYWHMIPGYDLMQNNIFVRPFIIKKYGIEHEVILDVLLYLFPIQYFRKSDFDILPTRNHISFLALSNFGYIESAIHMTKGPNVYRLTDRAVDIVRNYYQYLSGEKIFDPKLQGNPYENVDKTKHDIQVEEAMQKFVRQIAFYPKRFKAGLSPKIVTRGTSRQSSEQEAQDSCESA